MGLNDLREDRPRGIELVRRDRAMAACLPRREETSKHFVDEQTLLLRIHHLVVAGLFLEAQPVLRKELERARQIRLDRADRQRPRTLRASLTVISRVGCRRPRKARGRPLACVPLERVDRRRIE